ncbi:MAG: ATP-dependent Clp protease ATP-binding subunit [Ruminococcaceae bacterium]|nr:ATP-dependent Clp protease ATP-binding subunit [Oscillospiraceae bacterium]
MAILTASDADDGYIGSEHLLLGLLSAKTAQNAPCIAAKLLSSRGITAHTTAAMLDKPLPDPIRCSEPSAQIARISAAHVHFTPVLCRILARANEEAQRFLLEQNGNHAVIGSEHLLFSLLCENDAAAHHVLAALNLPLHELYGDVLSFLSAVAAEEAIFSGGKSTDTDDDVKHSKTADSFGTHTDALPFLLDMTACAADGKYNAVVGRDAEEEAVLRILLHRQKNNPCLLGDAGVGKTAIVEGLAARIVHGQVPSSLSRARIYALDLGGMLAGAKYRGEFEDRLKRVLASCQGHGSNAILFIDEIHMLVGAGASEGAVDAANLLKPALSRGEIRVIGATTKAEYDKSIGRDGAMSRRFQTVMVEEPDEDRAHQMLLALRPRMEQHHGVLIPEEVLRCAISVSVRCLPEFFLPDKAIDLLDDACAAVRTAAPLSAPSVLTAKERRDLALRSADLTAAQNAVHNRCTESFDDPLKTTSVPPTVQKEDIFTAAERRTGIRMTADEDIKMRYLTLEAQLNAVVFGQEQAISTIADVLRRQHTGLSDRQRPAASFLFCGPTGVGKTAVCETLAAILFDTPHAFLRFDMAEYREAHAAAKLIGAPPGYIGHDEGGILTSAIRHRPYALLLFDQIALAHPDVRHLFLQLLDNGYLTDSRGSRISFRHTIIVMTVNDHTEDRPVHPLGFTQPAAGSTENAVLSDMFSAEFLSRFDALIRFQPLDEAAGKRILRKQLTILASRLAERGISLAFDDALIAHLYQISPHKMGARGLYRTAEQTIETLIAQAMLNSTLRRGDCVQPIPENGTIRLNTKTDKSD